eukprot:symbB.v1.2.004760.t2/scaffold274.1/size244435/1
METFHLWISLMNHLELTGFYALGFPRLREYMEESLLQSSGSDILKILKAVGTDFDEFKAKALGLGLRRRSHEICLGSWVWRVDRRVPLDRFCMAPAQRFSHNRHRWFRLAAAACGLIALAVACHEPRSWAPRALAVTASPTPEASGFL